ncbi:lipid droplet assembly factor 1 [Ornithorhynchus anatinus]|uniref:Lipid droplet assembly factor 1 n=1 Tax=Ornithorhynchus anatinus TaxID=9258 RepID=F6R151_ORNAN|nr:lipid droplet assembly factor 1 [Ornithorhynchus anatinus]XP_028914401.1 lipid droplet assembly factor 1 [Ornithorhynchus anatinus]XP_028914402.1 lipid droplet assembly factor 1 [Ornithorhynchus anatinus]XP_039767028.1 lipid droplet assembly factor 1 [Ornithorhynchus anatinus]
MGYQLFETQKHKLTGKGFKMVNTEAKSTSRDLEELQKKLLALIDSIRGNPKVITFLNSPLGQYLDKHPFICLTLLVFITVSAIPVVIFLLLVVVTAIAACIGVILMEGVVISVGGLTLLCVLCGLGFVSLAMSGALSMCYVVGSGLINYWFPPNTANHQQIIGRNCQMAMNSAVFEPPRSN